MRLLVAAVCTAALGYLLFWPVDIRPQSWEPPLLPAAAGVYAPNSMLAQPERFLESLGGGGEAVVLDSQGRVYTGFANGDLYRFDPQTDVQLKLANTGGRPLGLALDAQERLWIADAVQGLMLWSAGELTVALSAVAGQPLGFADDLAIAKDGTIYLSDASIRHDHHNVRADFFEHAPNGRVVSYDPQSGQSQVVLDGLYFANGLALSPDEDFLLINETSRYQTRRLWLKGPQAGQADVWAQNWPGFPDNIRPASGGGYWLALYAPRNAVLDWALPRPFMRSIIWRLPQFLQPDPPHVAHVLRLSPEGTVLASYQGVGDAAFAPVTCAVEGEQYLWLGSLSANGLGRVPLASLR